MRVAIIQYRLLHYRVQLFESLREACARRGIELVLVYGNATRREAVKKDEGRLSWAFKVRNRVLEIGERDVIWQPLPRLARDADLIIVMQESRILSNYWLLLLRLFGKNVAYWGHGRNFQSDAPTGVRERWKRWLLNRIDWWFAYTSMTVEILREAGYPMDRVTLLNNAIDSSGFKADLQSWSDHEVLAARARLNIAPNAPVAVFCGSLYPDKRLDLLVSAGDLVKARFPEFVLLVIGDGPSATDLASAAESRPWIRLLGVKKGRDKALHFRMSNLMLNPGLVGLHIVDAFCAGLVMVTTSGARHSPEVAYLEHGKNGLMTGDTVASYGGAVVELLDSPQRMKEMGLAALAASERYTLDNMVCNFADGIEAAIKRRQA